MCSQANRARASRKISRRPRAPWSLARSGAIQATEDEQRQRDLSVQVRLDRAAEDVIGHLPDEVGFGLEGGGHIIGYGPDRGEGTVRVGLYGPSEKGECCWQRIHTKRG